MTGPLCTLCKPRKVCPLFPRRKREGIGGREVWILKVLSLSSLEFGLAGGGRRKQQHRGDGHSFNHTAPGWAGKIHRDGSATVPEFVVTWSPAGFSSWEFSLVFGFFFFGTNFKNSFSQPSLWECCPWILCWQQRFKQQASPAQIAQIFLFFFLFFSFSSIHFYRISSGRVGASVWNKGVWMWDPFQQVMEQLLQEKLPVLVLLSIYRDGIKGSNDYTIPGGGGKK